MDDLLIVLSNPRDGRHAEFNDWYSHIHVRDVMRLPGSSAVQRLRRVEVAGVETDPSFDYLAVYECQDIEQLSAGHGAVFTPMMLISDSFDFAMREAYYTPHVHRQVAGAAIHEGDYVIERIGAAAGPELVAWYDAMRMPALMALPGVVSGTFASVAAHQMLAPHADSHHVGLYRTQDLAATMAGWSEAPALPAEISLRLACYTPLIPRWTAGDVVHPSIEGRLAEARARVALGDRVHAGFPPELHLS
ncbi:hypothetical protein N6H05_19980 [Sphingobium sp. WTD-1]|uniref:DUF4286 family protein n=1 Tax=Sphingobium sp. WTD-1 TaxID=2979467 RepID=UPI0024DE8DB2|nr:DUF4286 family protein [Sphingobium sp. WTD-1]WIA55288.1 hypothetical protein N6H05_19980 [Sphingobium sp. WTD-1]